MEIGDLNYLDVYANAYSKAMSTLTGSGQSSESRESDLFEQIRKKYEGEQKILDSLYQVLDNIHDENDPDTVNKNKNKQYSLLEDTDTLMEFYSMPMLQNSMDTRNKELFADLWSQELYSQV